MADTIELDTFKDLCQKAVVACATKESTLDFEPEFVAVLEYIKAHPDDQNQFSSVFTSAIDSAEIPGLSWWELIPFCMAELKWPEILKVAEAKMVASDDIRIKESMSDLIKAYQPVWEDGDLYDYYSNHIPTSDLDT